MANFPIENRVNLTYNIWEVIEMAEFCPDCWNSINGFDEPPEAYVLSREYELCEGCGEWKQVIVRKRNSYILRYLWNCLLNRCKNRR